MASVAQMNVRLDRSLKAAGDAALAEAGISPTELVRELWEKISHGADSVAQVRKALREESQDVCVGTRPTESSNGNEALAHGRALFCEGLNELGIHDTSPQWEVEALDVDAYAEALMRRMHERCL